MTDNHLTEMGLPPEALRAAFPFHFAFDRALSIVQFGPTLLKLIPDVHLGLCATDLFRIVTPSVPFEFDAIEAQSFTVFFLESQDRRFKLKGQMLRISEGDADRVLFLGSPVVRDMSSVTSLGLTLRDFAIHDSAVDFLILLQTKTNTINDVKSMAERLKKEVGERREAQKALQIINDDLEKRVEARTEQLQTEVSERRRAEERVRETNGQLKGLVARLEEHNRQMLLLNTMGDMLQTCQTVQETHAVIVDALSKLFPGESGSLALYDAVTMQYRVVAGWGDEFGDEGREFPRESCWGLRRARMHEHDCDKSDATCAHLHHRIHPLGCKYVCIPLMTRGEPHGLLHLHGIPATDDAANSDAADGTFNRRQLIHSASEHISLSIANLKLQEHLRQQSIRDMLTGLYNRRYMEESLIRETARADRSGKPCGLVMIDVDHFKRFNDTYGHPAGDALLHGLGHFLQRHVRGEDIACRYGGEEFILILPGADADGTFKRAEQIRADVASELHVPYEAGVLPEVTISLGVACYPTHAPNAQDAVKAADVALYHAKQSGRNRVSVSTGALSKE